MVVYYCTCCPLAGRHEVSYLSRDEGTKFVPSRGYKLIFEGTKYVPSRGYKNEGTNLYSRGYKFVPSKISEHKRNKRFFAK